MDKGAKSETELVAQGTFSSVMRWLAIAVCFALAVVAAYWAYGSFDNLSSPDPDASNGILIIAGSVFSLASLAALIGGVVLFVMWPWRHRSL